MTLKSFYSHNHRLPSPWIRAVTPAPACLPPQLPKLPAGRQTGRLPSYCQGGQRRGRTGGERFNAPHTHTQGLNGRGRDSERQPGRQRKRKEHRHQPQKTDTDHSLTARTAQICPLPDSFTHLFPNSDTLLRESGSPRFTRIYKTHRQTQITSTHSKILSTHNSKYTYSQIHKDKPNFQIDSDSQTHKYRCNTDPHNSQTHRYTCPDAQIYISTDSYPTRQTDRHTFNTQIHR